MLVLLAAAVVLPRVNLLATREDAEISKLATNLSTVEVEISSYYTATGKFDNFSAMTNVPLEPNGANSAYIMGANIHKCFIISLDAKKKTITIEKGPDAENNICRGAYEYSHVVKMLSAPIPVKTY